MLSNLYPHFAVNAQTIERHLHQHFAAYRQEGEWFQVDFQTAVDEAERQTFETEEPGKLLTFEFESNQLRTMMKKVSFGFVLKMRVRFLVSAIQGK